MNVREQKPPRRSQRQAGAAGNVAVVNAGEDTDADHQIKIAMAAYFMAERRGFEPGHELEDWVAAEAEIANTETPSALKSIQSAPPGARHENR